MKKVLTKKPHKTFLRKEIHEIPDAVRLCLERFNSDASLQQRLKDLFKSYKKLVLIGCGTAYHACLSGKHIFRKLLDLQAEAEFAGEFAGSKHLADEKTLVIAVSQSGETADTLTAVRFAKENGAGVLAVCNVENSSLTREADEVVYTYAGEEVAIAATKSYITQLLVFYLIALLLCPKNKKTAALAAELEKLPLLIAGTLKCERQIKILAKKLCSKKCVIFLGRGMDFATAKEAALKVKETTYTFSDGLTVSELRHGTMALVDEKMFLAAFATQKQSAAKTGNVLKEAQVKGADVLLLTQLSAEKDQFDCNCLLRLPSTEEIFMPLLSIIPAQLFALWVSFYKGLDPDKPRNLTKSVTVE